MPHFAAAVNRSQVKKRPHFGFFFIIQMLFYSKTLVKTAVSKYNKMLATLRLSLHVSGAQTH